ncbi:MAG TPA: hypothetical protein VJ841_03660 [Candidatus Saccharimonadales bacterium]|nr:hypothetical protein [Candidatus Saccharimonadales bacterium]
MEAFKKAAAKLTPEARRQILESFGRMSRQQREHKRTSLFQDLEKLYGEREVRPSPELDKQILALGAEVILFAEYASGRRS